MSSGDELLTCPCGSQWFELHEGVMAHGRMGAAVSLTAAGEVVAYTGLLVCNSCGTAMAPPAASELQEQPELRLVQ
jgi:hypothetical protein